MERSKSNFVTVITYVAVNPDDPGFQNPTKPIGPSFTDEQAANLPYQTVKTAKGYRRVVASPDPITIIEKNEINALIKSNFIVICCGGGGIPVIREERAFHGVDAVIDKDLASAKLGEEINADIFIIASDVSGVSLNYGTPEERLLERMTVVEAKKYMSDGQFPAGSMGPKVKACIRFAKSKDKHAIITSIESIEKAVDLIAGTQIVND